MALQLRRADPNPPTYTIGALDLNWDLANIFTKSISANSTFTFSNAKEGKIIIFKVVNTSAAKVTLTWPASVVSADNNVSANKTRIYTFVYSGSSIYASSVES